MLRFQELDSETATLVSPRQSLCSVRVWGANGPRAVQLGQLRGTIVGGIRRHNTASLGLRNPCTSTCVPSLHDVSEIWGGLNYAEVLKNHDRINRSSSCFICGSSAPVATAANPPFWISNSPYVMSIYGMVVIESSPLIVVILIVVKRWESHRQYLIACVLTTATETLTFLWQPSYCRPIQDSLSPMVALADAESKEVYIFLGMCSTCAELDQVLELSVAMVLYDYYLTFPDEFRLVWQTVSIMFHFSNEIPLIPLSPFKAHPILMQWRFQMSAILPHRDFFCKSGSGWFYRPASVLVLRTYAIYDRNVKVLIGLGSLGLTVTAFNFSDVERIAETIATSLRVAFEIILIVLTIWRTAHIFQRQETRKVLDGTSLESLILQSGRHPVLYPGFNIRDAALVSLFKTDSFGIGVLNGFSLPLSAIIIAHFLLDIRIYADHPREATTLSVFRADPPSRALTNYWGVPVTCRYVRSFPWFPCQRPCSFLNIKELFYMD
ncbi:hypothetical protein K439DRAFT_1658003, partial [Ramaria rubella]